jgi:superfamily I DNA/RNA helicase
MTPFERARGRAAAIREMLLGEAAGTVVPAFVVLAPVTEIVGLAVAPVAPTSKSLAGADAALRRKEWCIYIRNDLPPAIHALYVAHELGHFYLDPEADEEGPDVELGPGQVTGVAGSSATTKVEAYGARERLELAANVFARELLLPTELARGAFSQGLGPKAVSDQIGLDLDMVRQQMLDAVLLPIPQMLPPHPSPELTEEQLEAAHASERFVNVIAGPGTGKTACLIERCRHLIEELGVEPSRIAALTFTNKAAASLDGRLRHVKGSHGLWAGTFHGFGLEFLRKFHQRFGLPADVQVVDDLEAILMLQPLVAELSLAHHSRLDDPLDWLPEALTGIHRLKEELISPVEYRAWVESQPDCDDYGRWHDTAEVYDAYDRALREAGRVDFVDLVALPALALSEGRAPYSEFIDRFDHVLIDEYQDVTRAMVSLLLQFGAHKSIWVVGDLRQAIHHWRGASLQSLMKFQEAVAKNHPSTKAYRLTINHRSTGQIAAAIEVAGKHHLLESTIPIGPVVARGNRQGPLPVIHELKDENFGTALTASITALHKAGVAYRSQMVVARTNEELERVATELRANGVPVLHVGDLNRRPIVRQLLCLMSLLVHRHPTAIVGLVADDLRLPSDDLAIVIDATREDPALQRGGWLNKPPAGLSASAQAATLRLAQLLAAYSWRSNPWAVVCDLVLEARLGLPPLDDASMGSHMTRLALWQLAYSARTTNSNGSLRSLTRFMSARRLRQRLDDTGAEREVPAQALELDAVRVMTVHGSKGLEAEAVHVVGISKLNFGNETPFFFPPFHLSFVPAPACGQDMKEYEHHAAVERNNLLFVALSRAQRHLHVYVRPKDEATGLALFAPLKALSTVDKPPPGAPPVPQVVPAPFNAANLAEPVDYDLFALYSKCPRRFYYRVICGLPEENPRVEAKKALRAVADALQQVAIHGAKPDEALTASWEAQRLPDPHQAQGLWGDAKTAFEHVVARLASDPGSVVIPRTVVSQTTISLPWMTQPIGSDNLIWFLPGRVHKKVADRIRPLLNEMAPRPKALTVISIVDGTETVPPPSGAITRTAVYQSASKREHGDMAPMPGRPCRRCGYALICPSLPK